MTVDRDQLCRWEHAVSVAQATHEQCWPEVRSSEPHISVALSELRAWLTDNARQPATTAAAPWTLEVHGDRPLTVNAVSRMHRQEWARHTRQARQTWWAEALAHHRPRWDRVAITATPLHRNRQSPQDTGACAPEVKAAIDGLVDAAVIPNDTGRHLVALTFTPPEVCGVDGLRLTVTPVDATCTTYQPGAGCDAVTGPAAGTAPENATRTAKEGTLWQHLGGHQAEVDIVGDEMFVSVDLTPERAEPAPATPVEVQVEAPADQAPRSDDALDDPLDDPPDDEAVDTDDAAEPDPDPGDAQVDGSCDEAIIAFLKTDPDATFSISDVQDAVTSHAPSTVAFTLGQLAREGLVARPARGRYQAA